MFNFFKRKHNGSGITEAETLLCNEANFAATEAYKLLRTNLLFTLPKKEGCGIIGITSAIRGEAKSTTAINLTYVLAQMGRRVLLIDGDLRLPSVSKKLGLRPTSGLSEELVKTEGSTDPIIKMETENWHVLCSGSIPPNPSEMLGSEQMTNYLKKLSSDYDVIVVDLPPVNIVSDALAISSALDGMIVVVRSNYSEKRELNKCLRSLALSNVKILGAVMTANPDSRGSYRYHKYRRGRYYSKKYYDYKKTYVSTEENEPKKTKKDEKNG